MLIVAEAIVIHLSLVLIRSIPIGSLDFLAFLYIRPNALAVMKMIWFGLAGSLLLPNPLSALSVGGSSNFSSYSLSSMHSIIIWAMRSPF